MTIEIKIPKDVRQFHESVFFGLTLRQFICSIIAVGIAVGVYFGLRGPLGQEVVSWVCILGAAPFAVAGFFTYNGMTLEQFIVAWVRSEFLCAGPRLFKTENFYMAVLEEVGKQAARRPIPKLPPKKQKKDKRTYKKEVRK